MSDPRKRRASVLHCFHRARMQPYLDACEQSEKEALALYRWNLQLSGAFQQLLSVVEVVLRNAMDRELRAWHQRATGSSASWLLTEPAVPLRSLTSGKRLQAKRRALNACAEREPQHPRFEAAVTHDDVLAQMTFGAWKELLPNHLPEAGDSADNVNRRFMWAECLWKAFPHSNDELGADVFWRVIRLHRLRNRVSHMEPLLSVDVDGRVRDVLQLLAAIDVDVSNWVSGWNPVAPVNRQRPLSPQGVTAAGSLRSS